MIEDIEMNDVEWKKKKLYILFLSDRIWIIYYILIIYLSMTEKKKKSLILGLGISI